MSISETMATLPPSSNTRIRPTHTPAIIIASQRLHSHGNSHPLKLDHPFTSIQTPTRLQEPLDESWPVLDMAAGSDNMYEEGERNREVSRTLSLSAGEGSALRILSHSQGAQMGFNVIKAREDESPVLLRQVMEVREKSLAHILPKKVNEALYNLLNAPTHIPCLSALADLARMLNLAPCPHPTLVDDEGSPYSDYILLFIDVVLVLYRSLATDLISFEGMADTPLSDPIDQAAFGALAATTSASRILILISHCHHHVVKALWFGLLYLSMAYRGTKRGVAIDYLLDTVQGEWAIREDRDNSRDIACWSTIGGDATVEAEWYRRARRVAKLRKKYKAKGGLWLGTVWAEMKGMTKVQLPPTNGEVE